MTQPPHDRLSTETAPDPVADPPVQISPADRAKAERAARLAKALRDNLRRRKVPKTDPAPPSSRN
ncbi:hypothetical protein [Brevundimonas sp. PAMC22021]|uniref:hypothetical protein n=1 Tax=Brevundimonas sp. PAMC22021 TaxID=2861285 RepID=UPI001C634162|nr:hypothetical protein [Brevundimonas sp. PAMC22021]QYF87761.1 hypothetical protein KY493_04500 [Brevundimonas sp. PAMC22021]